MLWEFHDDNRREYKYGLVIVCVLIVMTNCNIIAIIKSIEKLLCMRISIDGGGGIDYEWHRKKSQ